MPNGLFGIAKEPFRGRDKGCMAVPQSMFRIAKKAFPHSERHAAGNSYGMLSHGRAFSAHHNRNSASFAFLLCRFLLSIFFTARNV